MVTKKLEPKEVEQIRAAIMCPTGFRRYTPRGEFGDVTHLTENLTRVKFPQEKGSKQQ